MQDNALKINSIDFHRTDDLLVTASDDDSVHVYNTASAEHQQVFRNRKYGCQNICFTHSQSAVVFASNKVRHSQQRSEVCQFGNTLALAMPSLRTYYPLHPRQLPCTDVLAVCISLCTEGSLCSRHLKAASGHINCVFCQGDDHALRYCSIFEARFLRYFQGHTGRVVSVSMSPKNDTFLSASQVSCWPILLGLYGAKQ